MAFLARYQALSSDDRLDIFQDSVVCLVANATKEGFALTARLETYVISICKSLAGTALRKVPTEIPICRDSDSFDIISVADPGGDAETRLVKDEETSMLKLIFSQIGNSCKQLLTAFYFHGKSYREIVETLGLCSSEDSAKTAKNKCINKMRNVYENLR